MINRVVGDSFVYVLGDVLNKAVPFFLLPILTRYLTPEDFGMISIFTVLVSVLAVFTGLSIHGAINVNFFQMESKELKVFIGNCLAILNVSTLITLFLVYLFSPFILEKIALEMEWLLVAVVLACAQFLTTINLLLWTAEQRPRPYALYQLAQSFTIASLTLVLVVGFGMDWKGEVLAKIMATLLFSLISLVFIIKRRYLVFKLNKKHIKDALAFGVPLIPHSLSNWIRTGADRIVLMSLLGAATTGIYTVGYQIGMAISVVVVAFNKAWAPYLFKTLTSSPTIEDKKRIVKYTYIYFVGILAAAFCFSYVVQLAIPYLLGEDFLTSGEYVVYFSIAFSFQGMYLMVVNYIFFMKRTHILAYVTFGSSLLHIALLFVLVDKYGAIGAAQASVISFAITFFMVWYLASRIYYMPWKVWSDHD